MTDLRTAAQQALEALHVVLKDDYRLPYEKIVAATDALRAALAEPVQEPVAWVLALPDGRLDRLSVVAYDDEAEEMLQRSIAGCALVPLYTAPPQRQPLTQEQLYALYDEHATHQEEGPAMSGWFDFARAIERAHGIGGQE